MLWKDFAETEDCEQCPIKQERICKGGWTSSPSGTPIEPPCCSFDDDTDLDAWIDNYYDYQRRYEERIDRQIREKEEKRKKNEVAKRRRWYLKNYCVNERIEVKRLQKLIRENENAIRFANSIAFSFNAANEMFHYPERVSVNPKHNKELEKMKNQLKIAEDKLKEKQKEGRKTPGYLAIKLEGAKI